MVTVAVIGGTGSVGKTIVDAFLAEGTHEVIVVSRKVPEGKSAAKVIAVDYTNVEELTKTLEENNIHTVISTIVMYDPEAAQAERSFIAAADKSSCTKRFVVSNWGNATPEEPSLQLELNGLREPSIAAVRKTGLEWTQFYVGLFLDYYGMPHIPTYLTPLVVFVDMAHKTAALPGNTGDETVSFTYTQDLARFVVAAMGLKHWEEALHCYSENTSLSRLVQLAEEARGSKFTVTFDPVEKLARGEITQLPTHPHLYPYFPKPLLVGLLAKFGLWAVNGIMFVPHEGSLNEKFPEIKPKSVEEVVGFWKGK